MSTYQQPGWRRTLADLIYSKLCCKLWGHANGKQMTEGELAAQARGEAHGMLLSQIGRIMDMGKEIQRLCRLIEKRNRKIRGMRAALKNNPPEA